MGFQVLQIKDEGGNVFDLGITTPGDSTVAIRAYDKDVNTTLGKRFGVSVGTGQLVSSLGDTDLVTPTTGKKLRLKWFAMSTPESNTQPVVATVKLGTTVLYMWPLGAPGAFAHGSVREGATNEKLTINLSVGVPVYVNYEYEEF